MVITITKIDMSGIDIIVLVIVSACTLLLIGVGIVDVIKDFKRLNNDSLDRSTCNRNSVDSFDYYTVRD